MKNKDKLCVKKSTASGLLCFYRENITKFNMVPGSSTGLFFPPKGFILFINTYVRVSLVQASLPMPLEYNQPILKYQRDRLITPITIPALK